MAGERIGALTQDSIEAIVLSNSDQTKPSFQTSCSAMYTIALSGSENAEAPNPGHHV